ncbi:MAG: hypothetical protein H8F28_11670 [Fibrella sp.]|nr:hypothetical protein [Armatimonadota bacterium]
MKKGYGSVYLWGWTLLPSVYALCAALVATAFYIFPPDNIGEYQNIMENVFWIALSGVAAMPFCGVIRWHALKNEMYLSKEGKKLHKQVYVTGIGLYVAASLTAFWRLLSTAHF